MRGRAGDRRLRLDVGLTLRLLRHGETDWAAQRRYTGHVDVPLNARGRAQAEALRSLNAPSYDSVWSSDLSRCNSSAALQSRHRCCESSTSARLRVNAGRISPESFNSACSVLMALRPPAEKR